MTSFKTLKKYKLLKYHIMNPIERQPDCNNIDSKHNGSEK